MKYCSLPTKHLGPHRCDSSEHWKGACNDPPSRYFRDRRPCPGCGFVAIRTVSTFMTENGEEHVSPCTICNAESRAAHYANEYLKWSKRAKAMREKRLANLLKKEKLVTNKEST